MIVERARQTAADRAAQWPAARSRELAAAFERATAAALRAPVLAERSVRLRRVGKALIPASLRPGVRRVVAQIDALSRAATDAIGRRR